MNEMQLRAAKAQMAFMLADPALLVDVLQMAFFPEEYQDFHKWIQLQPRPPTSRMVYDRLAKVYNAPDGDIYGTDAHKCFRELAKYILAKAMNMEYKPSSLIQTTLN